MTLDVRLVVPRPCPTCGRTIGAHEAGCVIERLRYAVAACGAASRSFGSACAAALLPMRELNELHRLRAVAPPDDVTRVLREARERGNSIREATDRYIAEPHHG